MADPAPAAGGVYKPRRSQASPLFRLVSDHLHRLQTVYDERFAREYGPPACTRFGTRKSCSRTARVPRTRTTWGHPELDGPSVRLSLSRNELTSAMVYAIVLLRELLQFRLERFDLREVLHQRPRELYGFGGVTTFVAERENARVTTTRDE